MAGRIVEIGRFVVKNKSVIIKIIMVIGFVVATAFSGFNISYNKKTGSFGCSKTVPEIKKTQNKGGQND